MRAAITVLAALMGIDILIIAGTATGTPYFGQLALHCGLSLGLALIANAFIWAIIRPTVGPALATVIVAPPSRVFLVGGIVVVGDVLLASLTPPESAAIGEILYYLVLIGGGVVLARWAGSGPAAPIWVATLALLLVAIPQALTFFRAVGHAMGPEGYLFTLWRLAGRLNMLPLDATAAWAGWCWAAHRTR